MEVSEMLSHHQPSAALLSQEKAPAQPAHSTRRSDTGGMAGDPPYSDSPAHTYSQHAESPMKQALPRSPSSPKNVAFELHFDGVPNVRGRLPMRVQIFPHDTTESIVTTVKNFYGLYDGVSQAVSFEDTHGNTLIASYGNFTNDMVVYVRVTADYTQTPQRPEFPAPWDGDATSPQRAANVGEMAHQMLPPPGATPAPPLYGPSPPSRPGSRISRKQSMSPRLGSVCSASVQKPRMRSGVRSQGSFQADGDELNNDAHNGYSSSDCGAGSVTSSRKARSEQLASAEISVENIVEGGRRKKPKFSSSELPLYVPPQVPAPNSISSISPQRRSNGADVLSPFARPAQRSFTYNVPIQSPQDLAWGDRAASTAQLGMPFPIPPVPMYNHRLRDRSSGASLSNRSSLGSSANRGRGPILPTPDPTIASCISDEDVALQLMRLGDASNFSHGRTSASTMDDALSGRAEAASSASSADGDESEEDDEPEPISRPAFNPQPTVKREGDDSLIGPAPKKQRRALDPPFPNGFGPAGVDANGVGLKPKAPRAAPKAKRPRSTVPSKPKVPRAGGQAPGAKRPKTHGPPPTSAMAAPGFPPLPMSPASLPPHSRKVSLSSLHTAGLHNGGSGGPASAATYSPASALGPDEDDLSSKPRCQRCRKSKKGCDRQRPCQRCKDAGIGADGCISEDEGNGRKGRYGRHMGITVRKSLGENDRAPVLPMGGEGGQGPGMAAPVGVAPMGLGAMPVASDGEKGKKRKK